MLNRSRAFLDQVLMGIKSHRLRERGREGGKYTFVLHKPDSQLVKIMQALI